MHSMTLQTNDATITANDVLGRIAFASPNESGAEAVKVVGKFEVQAEEAFDASNNATKMVFYLAADGDAATRMTLSSAGTATLGGNLIIADAGNIGSASDPDAIAIADDGVVSFSATSTCPATNDGTALGTASKGWSDLFLATGGVVDIGNEGIRLEHSTGFMQNNLRFSGPGPTVVWNFDSSDGYAGVWQWNYFYQRAGSSATAIMYFGDEVSGTRGQIRYNNVDDSFSFYTDGSRAIAIDSSQNTTLEGNLIIADDGTIGSASDPDAIAIDEDGIVSFSATSTCPATNDGTALGTASKGWSDLFLATGGVATFNNGGISLTHSTGFMHNRMTFDGNASTTYWVFDNSDGQYDWNYFTQKAGPLGTAVIYFGDSDNEYEGQIRYNNVDDSFSFYTDMSKAITIDSSQNTEFDGIITADKAIRQGHADATDPSNVLTIDCSLSNYFEITHSSNALTAVEFENASEGQRIILQLKNGYYSGSMSSFWDDITINDDSDGDVIWAGGTEPSSAAGTTDLYGFVFSGDVKVAYGYIIGQDFKA